MEITPEIIEENYEALPEVLKPFVYSEDIDQKVAEIGKKHSLHIDQIGKIRNAIMLVVLAIVRTEDFSANLERELGLPIEEINKIVEDINIEIFSEIREALEDYVEEGQTENTAATQSLPVNSDKYRENPEAITTEQETKTLGNAGIQIQNTTPTIPKVEAVAPINLPIGNEEDKNTLGSAGISLAPEQKVIEEKRSPDMSTEKIMQGIQNPDAIPMGQRIITNDQLRITNEKAGGSKFSVMESKLAGTFSIPKVETEHAISKVVEPAKVLNTSAKNDPYREQV